VYYHNRQKELCQLLERKPPTSIADEPIEPQPLNTLWLTAVRAAEDKKAANIKVLDVRGVTSYIDFFIICTSMNPRQSVAIIEEVEAQLKAEGLDAFSIEGKDNGEWVLADYGDFLVHVFIEKQRKYFDLERLYRHAKVMQIPDAGLPRL
jgi:ribosome-associated protein